MQSQANVAVPQSVTTQPQSQQIVGVGVPANAVILKMSDIQQISTVGEFFADIQTSKLKLLKYKHRNFPLHSNFKLFVSIVLLYFKLSKFLSSQEGNSCNCLYFV